MELISQWQLMLVVALSIVFSSVEPTTDTTISLSTEITSEAPTTAESNTDSTFASTPELTSTSESTTLESMSITDSTPELTSTNESTTLESSTTESTTLESSTTESTPELTSTNESTTLESSTTESTPELTSTNESTTLESSTTESTPEVTSTNESTTLESMSTTESESSPELTPTSESTTLESMSTTESESSPELTPTNESTTLESMSTTDSAPELTSINESTTLESMSTSESISNAAISTSESISTGSPVTKEGVTESSTSGVTNRSESTVDTEVVTESSTTDESIPTNSPSTTETETSALSNSNTTASASQNDSVVSTLTPPYSITPSTCDDVCGQNSNCTYLTKDDVLCECKANYVNTSADGKPNCVLNLCTVDDVCENGGTCSMKSDGNVTCKCTDKHIGDRCECAKNICEANNTKCGDNAKCVSGCTRRICLCESPKIQEYNYTTNECQNIDTCKIGLTICKNNEDCEVNECKCKDGYEINGTCEDTFNICRNDTCPANSDCVNAEPKYWCKCEEGYYNAKANETNVKVDCQPITCNLTCHGNRRCIDTDQCVCKEGFEGDDCEPKSGSGCAPECKSNAYICVKVNETTDECQCAAGYYENIQNKCEDIDECKNEYINSLCEPYGKCNNTLGGFNCLCGNNTLNETTKGCDAVDECKEGTHFCDILSSTCNDTRNGYDCNCKKGYEKELGNATHCILEDKCGKNKNLCGKNEAKCVNNHFADDGFECICPLSMIYSNNICKSVSFAYPGQLKLDGNFTAALNDSKSEEFLTRKMAVEKTLSSTLSNDKETVVVQLISFQEGSIIAMFDFLVISSAFKSDDVKKFLREKCTNNTDNKTCDIVSGGAVIKVQIDSLDSDKLVVETGECTHRTLKEMCFASEAICTNEKGKTFNCVCRPGYEQFGSGENVRCKDENECLLGTHKCDNVTEVCVNTDGNFTCSCAKNYRKQNGICKKICDFNPCENNGLCTVSSDDFNEYECECKDGFDGTRCQIKKEELNTAGGWQAALGVAVAALVLTMIISAIVVYRLRKRIKQAHTPWDDSNELNNFNKPATNRLVNPKRERPMGLNPAGP